MTGDLGERTSLSSLPLRLRDDRAARSSRGWRCRWSHYFGAGQQRQGLPGHDGDLLRARRRAVRHHVRDDEGTHPARRRTRRRPRRQHFADLRKNRPWLAMFVLTLILFITLVDARQRRPLLLHSTTSAGQGLFSAFNVLGDRRPTIVGSSSPSRWPMRYRQAQRVHRPGSPGRRVFTAGVPRRCRPTR